MTLENVMEFVKEPKLNFYDKGLYLYIRAENISSIDELELTGVDKHEAIQSLQRLSLYGYIVWTGDKFKTIQLPEGVE